MVGIVFYVNCMSMQYLTGRRIPIINILIINLESRLQIDDGYA